MVHAAPDQKVVRITNLSAEEIVPMFGVPEALSYLITVSINVIDICKLLGVKKHNTTVHHPQWSTAI